MEALSTTHSLTWAFSHIAPGPYKYVSMSTPEGRAEVQSEREKQGKTFTTNLCGGTCDHCGTAISIVINLEGSNGKRFKVGSTCVSKADKTISDSIKNAIKSDVNKRRSKLNNEKISNEYRKNLELLENNKDLLLEQPHPKGWEGKTLLDQIEWYRFNAGNKKFNQIFKQLTKNLKLS